jgi:predicted component of type VI protein secretion system
LGRQSSTLGEDAIIGRFVEDRRNQINIEISGASDQDLQSILPRGNHHQYLKQSIELYIPRHLKLCFSMRVKTRSSKISESLLGFGASLGSKSNMGTLTFYA